MRQTATTSKDPYPRIKEPLILIGDTAALYVQKEELGVVLWLTWM